MTQEMKAMIELVKKSSKEVESMTKADKMFEELGWKKTNNPGLLENVFDDYYSEQDTVYEYYHDGKLTCRLYFSDGQIGNLYPKGYCDEHHYKVYLAIHEKIKELGWITE